MTPSNWRPHAKVRRYTWLNPDGSKTPGIAVTHRGRVLAHMDDDEARALADRIHDLLDADHTTESRTA